MNNHYRLMTLHEQALFRIMPKGYNRASKDVRNFIDELYKELDSADDYARKLNHRICKLYNKINKAIEYINHTQNYGKEKCLYVNGDDLLNILRDGE